MPTTNKVIEISETAAFVSLKNHLLVVAVPERGETTIPVVEILCLILANPAVTVTGAALAALSEAGSSVVICGNNRLPVSMLLPLQNNYIQTEKFHAQLAASKPLQKRLWQTVIRQKISRQADLLLASKDSDFHLKELVAKVGSGDPENIEGRASAIYWKNLFPTPFVRDRTASDNNSLLNYGYAILRAMSARACCGAGLHPTLGINHHNRYNPYCLADDLMEPFRPIVDRQVLAMNPGNAEIPELTKAMRQQLLSALLTKQETSCGMWHLADLLEKSAEMVARSFQTGENCLNYF